MRAMWQICSLKILMTKSPWEEQIFKIYVWLLFLEAISYADVDTFLEWWKQTNKPRSIQILILISVTMAAIGASTKHSWQPYLLFTLCSGGRCGGDFDPILSCHPGDFLTEFFKLCCRKESSEDILGRGVVDEEGKGQDSGCTGYHGDLVAVVCTFHTHAIIATWGQ